VNAKRNRYYALVRKYESQGNFKKANRIKENNLGKKKYDRLKEKHDSTVKSDINYSLNQFFSIEKPSDLIQEDLSFVSWKKKFSKEIKRKLTRWIKGYVKERIEFKCSILGVNYHNVNAAYTSQLCHQCGHFGKRNEDLFTCENCGEMHADINASKNILARLHDPEIDLYTNYKTVKKILESRISA
jgi:putative transposase